MCANALRPNFDECMTTMVRSADSIISAIIWASCRFVVVNPARADTPPTPMTLTTGQLISQMLCSLKSEACRATVR
jgi:hypothetical protein